jgi:hypothetical protein
LIGVLAVDGVFDGGEAIMDRRAAGGNAAPLTERALTGEIIQS